MRRPRTQDICEAIVYLFLWGKLQFFFRQRKRTRLDFQRKSSLNMQQKCIKRSKFRNLVRKIRLLESLVQFSGQYSIVSVNLGLAQNFIATPWNRFHFIVSSSFYPLFLNSLPQLRISSHVRSTYIFSLDRRCGVFLSFLFSRIQCLLLQIVSRAILYRCLRAKKKGLHCFQICAGNKVFFCLSFQEIGWTKTEIG